MSGLFNEIERLCGGSTPQMLDTYFGTRKEMTMEKKLAGRTKVGKSDVGEIAVRIPQMAKRLNIGLTKAHEMVRNGEVDSVVVGRTRLVSIRSIDALLEKPSEKELRPVATDKGIEGFAEIAQQALSVDYGQAKGAIADAQAALKRIIKRAEAAPDERWEINVSRGARLEFSGKLLCSDTFTTKSRDPLNITLEIYQTDGGALIGVSSAVPAERQGHETIEATVVEPGDDVQAMRFAIMDSFNWELRARSMVTKQLGWSLRREVA